MNERNVDYKRCLDTKHEIEMMFAKNIFTKMAHGLKLNLNKV